MKFYCPVCDKAYVHAESLKTHIRKYHPGAVRFRGQWMNKFYKFKYE